MRLPQVHVGDLLRSLPEAIGAVSGVDVVELGPEVALEEVAHRLPDPCRHVDAVGHGQDLLVAQALPGVVGGDAVQLADGVGAVRESQREGRHVELADVAVDAAGQLQDAIHRDAAGALATVAVVERPGHSPDEFGVEALVAGGDGRVDREDAVGADPLERVVQRHSLGHERAGALHEQEGGVAFVQVPDRGRDAEGLERANAAGAEHQLLVEAHLAAADIEDVGDRPVRLGVVRYVRIQQEDRNAPCLDQPHRGVEVAPGQLDGDRERLAVLAEHAQDRQLGQVVVGVGMLLMAVGVDRLTKVAVLVQQAHADERHGHVAGGLDVVAGEDAEAAGVDAQALVEAVLGAEVADRAARRRSRTRG